MLSMKDKQPSSEVIKCNTSKLGRICKYSFTGGVLYGLLFGTSFGIIIAACTM